MKTNAWEWPTLAMLALCYAVWGVGAALAGLSLIAGIFLVGLAVALQSSLQHEVIHGHPTPSPFLNAVLVFPALSLLIPFVRFKDTHLDHHMNAELTDPYDDPESNYLDPAVWDRLPRWVRALLAFNNTLLGRITVGVAISQIAFMTSDLRRIRQGDRRVIAGWLWHIPAVALVIFTVAQTAMPLWAYLIAAYIGLSLIKIRTFLEHQAHERAAGRTAIIEGGCWLSLLFLNNNLHAVHHAHPRVPWYGLPKLYRSKRDIYLARNGNYHYGSYGQVFRQHLLRRKDNVPHPFWR